MPQRSRLCFLSAFYFSSSLPLPPSLFHPFISWKRKGVRAVEYPCCFNTPSGHQTSRLGCFLACMRMWGADLWVSVRIYLVGGGRGGIVEGWCWSRQGFFWLMVGMYTGDPWEG